MLVVLRHFLSFCSCTTLKVFRNGVHVCAFILFLAYLLRNRVCMHTRNVNNKYCIVITPVEQVSKYAASRLCLVTETAYYVHTVLTLRLPGVTVGYCLRIFAFYSMFSAKPLLGFHSRALTLQEKFEFHKSLKVIR